MSDSDEEYDPAAVAPRPITPPPSTTTATTTPSLLSAVSLDHASTTKANLSAAVGGAAGAGNTSAAGSRALPALQHAAGAPLPAPIDSELTGDGGLRLHGIKGPVRSLCLNSTATRLCAAGQDGQLCMWDFTVPLEYPRLQPTRVLTPFVNRIAGLQPIVSVHCACDDAYFVACQDGDCPVIISATGKQLEMCAMGERGMLDVVKCKAHRAPVTCSAPHPATSALFFTGSQDGTARRWDANAVTRGSTYAIKHGSGQITEKIIVESVCGLQSTGSGHVFASGGEDGCVQLWDARVKYRPGGSLCRWDLYDGASASTDTAGFFSTSHVGGMIELDGVEGGPSMLVVRSGASLQCLDLRAPKGSVRTRVGAVVTGLAPSRDTTPLATGHRAGTFFTCTGHDGFSKRVGGHVVGFTCSSHSESPKATSFWRAAARGTKEDVLCVAVDRSREGGSCFAGLDTGDVVVQLGAHPQQPIRDWLATRPGQDTSRTRQAGQKSTRADALDDDDEPLF